MTNKINLQRLLMKQTSPVVLWQGVYNGTSYRLVLIPGPDEVPDTMVLGAPPFGSKERLVLERVHLDACDDVSWRPLDDDDNAWDAWDAEGVMRTALLALVQSLRDGVPERPLDYSAEALHMFRSINARQNSFHFQVGIASSYVELRWQGPVSPCRTTFPHDGSPKGIADALRCADTEITKALAHYTKEGGSGE